LQGTISPINTPLNPYQFNYSDYMENLGVLRQMNVQQEAVLQTGVGMSGLRQAAGSITGTDS
jgi:competence protein ComEC